VFLSAGSEDIARVYHRLGFRRIGTCMHRRIVEEPVVAAVLGALTIAFSAILVDLADVSPRPPRSSLPLRAARARRAGVVGGPAPRAAHVARAAGWRSRPASVRRRPDRLEPRDRRRRAGLATVLGNLQVVIVPFLALALLGERVPRRILLSLPIVLFGILLVSGALESGAYGVEPVARRALRRRHRAHVRGVPARPAPGERRPAAAGGPLFDTSLVTACVALLTGWRSAPATSCPRGRAPAG
jgi:hypothetical protein